MPRDRGITDRAKRKKQTAKNKRPAENDSVGESSTRPASMGKRMRALATQAAAARAYLDSRFGPDLPAQLSTLADTVRELPGNWTVLGHDAKATGNAVIFHAMATSRAELLPADLDRAGLKPSMHAMLATFDVRVWWAGLTLAILGHDVPAEPMQRLMRMTDPQARHEQVSSSDKEENGEVDHAVLDEMLNFSDLLCAPGITVPLRHELIGYERTSWQGGMDRAKEGGTPPPWVTASTGSCLLGGIPTFFSTYSSSFSFLLLPTNHSRSQLAPSLSFHFRILTHAFDQQRIMPLAHAIGTSCWCSCC